MFQIIIYIIKLFNLLRKNLLGMIIGILLRLFWKLFKRISPVFKNLSMNFIKIRSLFLILMLLMDYFKAELLELLVFLELFWEKLYLIINSNDK